MAEGFYQGIQLARQARMAREEQRRKVEVQQQRIASQQEASLLDLLTNQDFAGEVKGEALRGIYTAIPEERFNALLEVAKLTNIAREQKQKREDVLGLITTTGGAPGGAAELAASMSSGGTPEQRAGFNALLGRILSLPPEQAQQALSELRTQTAVETSRRGEVLEQERRAEARRIVGEERAERRLRERPDQFTRTVDQYVQRGLLSRQAGDAAMRVNILKDSIGPEATALGIKLNAGQQRDAEQLADIGYARRSIEKATEIAKANPQLFGGMGRATRFLTGTAGLVQDFISMFDPEDRDSAQQFISGTIASAAYGEDFADLPEIQNRARKFLVEQKTLGTLEAFIFAAALAGSRAETNTGRVTRETYNRQWEQLQPSFLGSAEADIARFEGLAFALSERERQVTQRMELTGLGAFANRVSTLTSDLFRDPTTVDIEAPKRQAELDRIMPLAEEDQGYFDEIMQQLRAAESEALDLVPGSTRPVREASQADLDGIRRQLFAETGRQPTTAEIAAEMSRRGLRY